MPAIDIDSIRAAVARAGVTGLRVEAVAETGSTNRVLMDAPFGEGPASPRLLAAARQTAGRGRQGRGWVMEPGRSAAFSIAIERRANGGRPAVGLSIVAGVAVAGALASLLEAAASDPGHDRGIGLKWPNDLRRDGCKIGGILVESRRGPVGGAQIERYVVGIGLNLLAPRDEAGAIGQPATGLFDGESLPVPAEAIVGRVAASVVDAARLFFREGLAPFADGWHRFDALRGRQVVALVDGRSEAVGVARGIDADGALLLDTAAGLRAVRAGEVSVRAVADRQPLAES
jgi:BirA family biotin operon repressor/biotin-[acetyl-CoA-carboxylase] ligase